MTNFFNLKTRRNLEIHRPGKEQLNKLKILEIKLTNEVVPNENKNNRTIW
jgi:hypothetical protein